MNNYDVLAWDTAFFGFKVAKIINSKSDLLVTLISMSNNDVRLAYLSSSKRIKNPDNKYFKFVLVDKKITYSKSIAPISQELISTVSLLNQPINKQLINLAISSGGYSRFNIDPNIHTEKFEELYKLWLINSLNGEIADEVLVSKQKDRITGIVTIGKKKNHANIGIIAVDSSFRSQGIGKGLIYAAEHWALNNGYQTMDVTTQGDNLAACKLYESCGYEIIDSQFIYHLWPIHENLK